MTDPHGADSAEIERVANDASWEAWPSARDYSERLAYKDAFIAGYTAALRTPPDDAVKLREAAQELAECADAMGEAANMSMCDDAIGKVRAALKGTAND